jgi:hypothetical protein
MTEEPDILADVARLPGRLCSASPPKATIWRATRESGCARTSR